MIKISNPANFRASVESWISAVETAAENAAKGLAHKAFNHVLYISPQASGDFVANWKIEINKITPSFDENATGGRDKGDEFGGYLNLGHKNAPYSRGSPQAINYAKQMAAGALDGFKLGGKIFLHNSAAHDEPYAWKIENGRIHLRPENLGATRVVARAAAHVLNRYKTIYRGQLAELTRRYGT